MSIPRDVLLIFDLDGTLFRSETVTVPAVREAFRAVGLSPPPDEAILGFFGRPHPDFEAWLRSLVPPAQGEELVASVDRMEYALVSETGRLYPGVQEALRALSALPARMAICTNGHRAYVERVIEARGLRPHFDAVRYRRDDRDTKETMVEELLAYFMPRRAVMIGDRWDDVAAARRNRILSVGAGYGYGAAGELAGADAVVETPGMVPATVAALLGLS